MFFQSIRHLFLKLCARKVAYAVMHLSVYWYVLACINTHLKCPLNHLRFTDTFSKVPGTDDHQSLTSNAALMLCLYPLYRRKMFFP